ncbi:MAG: amidohydrolase family protein [Chloroflexota bacterium]|nr:amidohydrolase family protein [Chloroflexota bacterium]
MAEVLRGALDVRLLALALLFACAPTAAPAAAPGSSPTGAGPAVAEDSPQPTTPAAQPASPAVNPSPPPTVSQVAQPNSPTAIDPLVFDAHVHYNRDAWAAYPPERVLEILVRSGVQRALVSSTPDDGTLRLYDLAPDIVVPILRPYRGPGDASSWTRDGTIVPYVESRYRRAVHRGIGEIHLYPGESEFPTVRAIVGLAVRESLVLQIHADDRAIEEVMRGPAAGTRVLWAHAGQTASPESVLRLLERYPALWVELSGRLDVAPDGRLDPAWRDLFVRHPDRFLVGTDTWINEQWEAMPDLRARDRGWLAQLPADVAARIASGNALTLFPPQR